MLDMKKIAAITAAVNTCLEEEACLTTIPQEPTATVSLWQVSGRQDIMQMRTLWQWRITPR